MTTKQTYYRVASIKKNGKLVCSYQCNSKMDAAILMARIEQAGMDARMWTERN